MRKKINLNWLYTGLLLICFGLSGWLLGQIWADRQQTQMPRAVSGERAEGEEGGTDPVPQQTTDGEQGMTLAVTPEVLTEVLESALPEDFLLEQIQLDMPAENRLALNAQVSKERLQHYLQDKHLDSLATKTALYFLPESSPVSAEFSLEIDGESGCLLFAPVQVSIGDWQVPAALLSPVFLEEIGQAINEGMLTSEWFFQRVSAQDGVWLLETA